MRLQLLHAIEIGRSLGPSYIIPYREGGKGMGMGMESVYPE